MDFRVGVATSDVKSSNRDGVMFDLVETNLSGFSIRVGKRLDGGMRRVGIEFDDSINS